jgi:hypothetical protein
MSIAAEIAALVKSSPRVSVEDFAPGARLHAAVRPLSVSEAEEDRARLARLEDYLRDETLTDLQVSQLRNAIVATKLRLQNVYLSAPEAVVIAERGKALCDAMKRPELTLAEREQMLREVKEVLEILATRRLPVLREENTAAARIAARALKAAANLGDSAFKIGNRRSDAAAAKAAAKAEKRKLATV